MNGFSGDDVIRSPGNAAIKRIRSLRQRKSRDAERAFVVEGVRNVDDALRAGGRAQLILIREDAEWHVPDGLGRVAVRRAVARLFNDLAETETPQPVMAIFDMPHEPPAQADAPLYLVVDGVRDPGNLGTLLRSAAAAGATAAVIVPGTVDPFNGKTVRAGMGAHFRVPIVSFDTIWREEIMSSCQVRVLADASADLTYDRVAWGPGAALIIGSEAHGASGAGRALATCSARIPLTNGVESLNAGVAGSVMLFEAARQRRGDAGR